MLITSFTIADLALAVVAALCTLLYAEWRFVRRTRAQDPPKLLWQKSANNYKLYKQKVVDYCGNTVPIAEMEVVDLTPNLSILRYQLEGGSSRLIVGGKHHTLMSPFDINEGAKMMRRQGFSIRTIDFSRITPPIPSEMVTDHKSYEGLLRLASGGAQLVIYKHKHHSLYLLMWGRKGEQGLVTRLTAAGDIIEACRQATQCMLLGGTPAGDLWPV